MLAAALVCSANLTGCTSSDEPAKGRAPASPAAPSSVQTDFSAGRSTPVAEPIYPKYGNPAVDVLHYGLDLAWAKDTRQLTGQATVHLRATTAVDAITLDFSDAYAIDAATVDGRRVTAKVEAGKLTVPAKIAADGNVTLVVKYHGEPATLPMPSHRGDSEPLGLTITSEGALWTMQEPYGAATWYPANDIPSDKALYDIAVTAPDGWTAVASGSPKGRTGNTFRFAATDPVASYLTTLAVGPYEQETATGPHDLPLSLWYQRGRHDRALPALRKLSSVIAWLEQRFGRYPFQSAGVVMVPSESAMETQETITMGSEISDDTDVVEAVLLHEFSHQWFGDSVTPSTWTDLWLNEGFATYAQALYAADRGGRSISDWEQTSRRNDGELRRKIGPPGSPPADSFAESNVYLCPALMLRQIHKQIGDDAFFTLAREWVAQHRNSVQDRRAFVAFVNKQTGRDFTALINSWLDSPTTP